MWVKIRGKNFKIRIVNTRGGTSEEHTFSASSECEYQLPISRENLGARLILEGDGRVVDAGRFKKISDKEVILLEQ